MNLEFVKEHWKQVLVILLLVTFFVLLLTPSNEPNFDGATWECEQCKNPNVLGYNCSYPLFATTEDANNCVVTCQDNSTIQTWCIKSKMVRYNNTEVSK